MLLCLVVVCLTLLASFLPSFSHLSLTHVYTMYMERQIHVHTPKSASDFKRNITQLLIHCITSLVGSDSTICKLYVWCATCAVANVISVCNLRLVVMSLYCQELHLTTCAHISLIVWAYSVCCMCMCIVCACAYFVWQCTVERSV